MRTIFQGNFVVKKTAVSTLTGSNFTQCDGSTGQNVTLYNNGGTATNYAINWGDGNNQPVTAASIGPAGVQHTYTGQGFHTITIQATATGYCTDTKTFTVYNGTNPSVGLNIPSGTRLW